MGQKVDPRSLRLGPKLPQDYYSVFFDNSKQGYSQKLLQDYHIRKEIGKKYDSGIISDIKISRSNTAIIVDIHSAKPGIIIGKSGSGIDKIKSFVKSHIQSSHNIFINVHELERKYLEASIVADDIKSQLQRRAHTRKAIKSASLNSIKDGAIGIKVSCSGRLQGAEIAKTETYIKGSIQLHTLRSNISYSSVEAKTAYGIIGIKVWINRNYIK
ncbi:MAG TPA: 30S ribosomal protein S3 [Candidatus Megaira endosymbiont of Hartmannula sinica]|nr:30S ribosomal protein S3 [Candidatus Megaera endosymbiont of Hartmannula sinica]